MDTTTNEQEVPAGLAALNAVDVLRAALAGYDGRVPDKPAPTLGVWLTGLRELIDVLKAMERDVENAMVVSMDEGTMVLPNGKLALRVPRSATTTWDRDRVRADIVKEVQHRIGTDPSTGEVRGDWKFAVTRAVELLEQSYTLGDPKVTGLKVLGLTPANYRTILSNGQKVDLK